MFLNKLLLNSLLTFSENNGKLLWYHFLSILLGLLNWNRVSFDLLLLFLNPMATCDDIELDFESFLLNLVNINWSYLCLLFDLLPFTIKVESYSVGILLLDLDLAKLEYSVWSLWVLPDEYSVSKRLLLNWNWCEDFLLLDLSRLLLLLLCYLDLFFFLFYRITLKPYYSMSGSGCVWSLYADLKLNLVFESLLSRIVGLNYFWNFFVRFGLFFYSGKYLPI